MADPWAQLAAGARALALPLDPEFEPRCRLFLAELERWSRVGRLTGYRTESARVRHLLLDSLLFLVVLRDAASPLLDIGSGPGVPGLVLKLARPAWTVHLVEASRRRANFLRHVVRRLELEAVTVHEARAEALASRAELAHAFAAVTLRAVAAPAAAAALAGPFVRPGGRIVIPLGPGARPGLGTVQRVTLPGVAIGLRIERTFLIITANDSGRPGRPDVPRETPGGAWRGS